MSDRSTGDLLILMVAATVCSVVILGTVAVGVVAAVHPDTDVSRAAAAIGSILSTLVGIIAGFLAGRIDRKRGG